MPLSEHVYCLAVTFKMTERVQQRICIRICIKLEHSSMETIWIIQKAAAMGKWWLAASSQQPAHSCITYQAEVFGKTSKSPRWLSPLQPSFGTFWLLAFPKTKITFAREEISDNYWDSGKYDGAFYGNWENCMKSQGTYFEGDWGITVLCTMFFISCIFCNKCLFFIVHGWILSGRVCVCVCVCVCARAHARACTKDNNKY